MRYTVVITRTITTWIKVDADGMQGARFQVENYGVLEAASDYPHSETETQTAKITKVRPCTS